MSTKYEKIQHLIVFATQEGSSKGRISYEDSLDKKYGISEEMHKEHQNIITEMITLKLLESIEQTPYLKLGIEGIKVNEVGGYSNYVKLKNEKEDLNNKYLVESYALVKKTNKWFNRNKNVTIISAGIAIASLLTNIVLVMQNQPNEDKTKGLQQKIQPQSINVDSLNTSSPLDKTE